MTPFEWNFPTRLIYGPGRLEEIGQIASEYGKRAFIATYRKGGSLDPVLARIEASLKAAGLAVSVFSGIEPNPRAQTIDKAIEQFKADDCDMVIALGGGSVIDGSKYIAATAFSGGKSWDYVVLGDRKPRDYTGAYPIIAVPTVSAAGSESNAGGVIQNAETNEKSFSRSPYRIPKAALVDPEILATLPEQLTKDSCIDIFSHLIEHYLSSQDECEFADRMTEGMILCLKDSFKAVLSDLTNVEIRANLSLCSEFGWSGLQALGRLGSIPMHSVEMPLSGYYDLPHGRGMIIVIPAYLEYMADVLPHRWAKLARRCFDVTEPDDNKAAKMLAGAVKSWFKENDAFLTLSDVGIGKDKFEQMADDVIRMFPIPGTATTAGARPLNKQDIINIYELCYQE